MTSSHAVLLQPIIMHVTASQAGLVLESGDTERTGVSSVISPGIYTYSRIWLFSTFNIVSGIQGLYVGGYAIVKDSSFYQKGNSKGEALSHLNFKIPGLNSLKFKYT